MNVSSWSIKNPIPGVMLFIMLTLAGLMSFHAMKIQSFPDIELPTITVSASLPGAAPPQLETEVARKIENSIATLQGLKNQYATIQDGVVTITAEFRLEKPIQEALDDVRNAVAQIRSDLPADLRDPVVSKLSLSGSPILVFTVASNRMDEEALSWFVDNTVTRQLLTVPGVGAVARVGGVTRQVQVELDPAKLLALGATAADVSRQLRSIQQEASGGRTDVGGAEQSVRTLATVQSADELARMEISLSDGRKVRLDQIATVKDTVAERRSTALLNGEPVVGFEITRSKGASEIEVAEGVNAALDKLKAQHADLKITEAFNFVTPVAESYRGSMWLLYEGAILAVLVVWLFLRDWRATFIAATALPLSVIPAFIGMHYLGFTLNTVTLLAMSLVVGILVDDAIVEIENIIRHLRMGKTPYQAAMEAADEIGLAVIATTFTLVAVFLPTAFMGGIPGKFFVQFGWTAALAVLASLVVARVLTPMMAAYMLKPWVAKQAAAGEAAAVGAHDPHAEPDGRVMNAYMGWVAWCLRNRLLTMVASLVLFAGGIVVAGLLPTGFIPPDDTGQTQVKIELPPGSRFDETLAAAEAARAIVAKHPEVRSVYTAVGGGAAGSDPFAGGAGVAEARKATLTIRTSHRKERSISLQEIDTQLREQLGAVPGVRVQVGLAGAGGSLLQLALSGDDPQALLAASRELERELRTIPNLGNITSTAALIRPELVVRPDFARAADLGVTSAAIADTLRIATAGDFDQSLAKLNLSQRQVPIVVKLPADARADLGLIERLMVPGARGPVMLGNVATVSIDSGPAQIDRFNRLRNVNFTIELNNQPLGDVQAKVDQLPTLKNLPPGVTRTNIGDAEVMAELFTSFGLAMLTGVLCIYVVLVLLFKDFLQPGTILVALFLSIPGAFVALLVTGKALSMPAMIGLIMLIGIATKNSILLVDYVILARREGMSRWDALLDACHKRARPIIMTSLAMGAGMLPIALGIGADPSFRAPMAIAVIGGLITSTFLSLLVVPVAYALVDDLEVWLHKVSPWHRKRMAAGAQTETAPAAE
ncbi:efflux RND transporter permease subunit [Piscinibacterium candidicorallinum]|uniref:Efflux RND transporter permease subunit n=1 Tax=Piscinibacterium candidicorallinum TaxID=1793872 RepID=A0ABV7H5G6_9BURK